MQNEHPLYQGPHFGIYLQFQRLILLILLHHVCSAFFYVECSVHRFLILGQYNVHHSWYRNRYADGNANSNINEHVNSNANESQTRLSTPSLPPGSPSRLTQRPTTPEPEATPPASPPAASSSRRRRDIGVLGYSNTFHRQHDLDRLRSIREYLRDNPLPPATPRYTTTLYIPAEAVPSHPEHRTYLFRQGLARRIERDVMENRLHRQRMRREAVERDRVEEERRERERVERESIEREWVLVY